MKKQITAIFGIILFSLQLSAQQKKQSGAIQFVTAVDPVAMAAANGIKLSDDMLARMPKASKSEFELLFNATNASYMPASEIEDSNGGGGGGGGAAAGAMRGFGGFGGMGAANRDLYFNFLENKLTEVFDMSDTTYFLQAKLGVSSNPVINMGGMGPSKAPVTTITKTSETKKILGLNCNLVIFTTVSTRKIMNEDKEITDVVNVWYTNELGFNFSPRTDLWTEGAVLSIEARGSSTTAQSIEYRNVSNKDVNLPKKGVVITADEYKAKMEQRMKQMRNNRGNGNGNVIRVGGAGFQ